MEKPINTILVDDEAGCIDNLQYYLHTYCPRIHVIATASDTEEAVQHVKNLPIQLAFLDVHLFDHSIFEIIPQIVRSDLSIVFATAYEQYALNAFRVSALDYLVKPFEKAEILRCYDKITKHYAQAPDPPDLLPDKTRKIVLRQGEHVYVIEIDSIIMLKAKGFYTHVFFDYNGAQKEIVLSKPINLVHKEWETPMLMRIHRSYVINLKRVISIKRNGASFMLEIGDAQIPVAKSRVTDFLDKYHG